MTQRILVPLGLDETSRPVLSYALEMARQMRADVDVLHVWEPPRFVRPDLMVYLEANGQAISLAEFSQNQAREGLAKLVAELATSGPTPKVTVAFGAPAAEVLASVARENYDLIIMGTRGQKGLPRALLGSVAEKVVRLAPCPVLVVPTRE